MNGIFDGFGMINRFEMHDGQICYTSARMSTMYRNVSEAKGCVDGFLFEDTTPARPVSCYRGAAQIGGDNNWVNAISVGDEVMMLRCGSLWSCYMLVLLLCSNDAFGLSRQSDFSFKSFHLPYQ